MIPTDVLLSPLALAALVAGLLIALVAGRLRRDPPAILAMTAIGSAVALAGVAWAAELGNGALFAATAVGFGASLWAIGNERGRRSGR